MINGASREKALNEILEDRQTCLAYRAFLQRSIKDLLVRKAKLQRKIDENMPLEEKAETRTYRR